LGKNKQNQLDSEGTSIFTFNPFWGFTSACPRITGCRIAVFWGHLAARSTGTTRFTAKQIGCI
jgi:hypothetical protein